jgi:hypothetical protein
MAEGTITTRLIEDQRTKSPKQKCFSLRKRLDSSPGLLQMLRIALGIFATSHVFASFVILIVSFK